MDRPQDFTRGTRGAAGAVALAALISSLATACVEDRCSEGEYYSGNKCWEIDTETDTGTDEGDAGAVGDAGEEMPTCMGQACTGPGTGCEGCEADYCAWDPINELGACTVQDCATAPDDCPDGYTCCDFMEGLAFPNFCMPDTDWQEQHDDGICVD
jgi:hypothetical protein